MVINKETMLKFIAMSGTTGVTQNMYLYEYGNDILIVDCGVGFPEPDMYGVDLVIPDFSYVLKNRQKVRGVIISHGHEDHIGALPYLLQSIKVPIYATKLVAGFIEDKLVENKIKDFDLRVIDSQKDILTLGVFKVSSFRISHSVPDGIGLAIDTPEGKVFHVPDYKFDWTPVNGKPFDITRASMLASEGVLALASDCLGSTTPGYTKSEKEIESSIETIVAGTNNRVIFTTISSNISRIQQAINVARRRSRKVVFIGRSIEKKISIARRLGYADFDQSILISPKQAKKMPKNRLMYVVSGSYGQPGSALRRISVGEHDMVKVEDQDVVIFSSDPAPPGSKTNVDFVVDALITLGAEVHYYDTQEDLHVSGHGSEEDIKMLFALVKPKYLVPIGGTIRHMRAYRKLARDMGADGNNVFELERGEVVMFSKGNAKKSGKIQTRDILVDGLGVGDVGNVVLRDRQLLAQEGVVIAVVEQDRQTGSLLARPDIISRGFVFQGGEQALLTRAASDLEKLVSRSDKKDPRATKDLITDFLERFFYKETGRRPMIIPVVYGI